MKPNLSPLAHLLASTAASRGLSSSDIQRLLREREVYVASQSVRYWHTGATAPHDRIRPIVADVYGVSFLDLSRAAAGLVNDSACAPDGVISSGSGKGGGAGFPFIASQYIVGAGIDYDRLSIDLPMLTGENALELLAELLDARDAAAPVVDKDQVPLFNTERS